LIKIPRVRSFHFWFGIIITTLLSILGFVMGSLLPLPDPYTESQSRITYTLLGALLGLLVFARVASWLVFSITRLTRLLTLRIAAEILNQLSHLTTAGLPFFPSNRSSATESITLSNPLIVDTSALIDGRILDVARANFFWGILLIPDFVLRELQQVADSTDSIKRARGRRGFEVVEGLKKIPGIKVQVWDKQISEKAVDDRLIALAKALKGRIITCDFNLNKVASINNIKVLNLNDLANGLKALPVPGENMKVKIVHLGKDQSQGIGYLSDGTMIVIKDAAASLGKSIEVETTKILQGSAGRMLFAKKL
jgi:uncharacterized protein YacL